MQIKLVVVVVIDRLNAWQSEIRQRGFFKPSGSISHFRGTAKGFKGVFSIYSQRIFQLLVIFIFSARSQAWARSAWKRCPHFRWEVPKQNDGKFKIWSVIFLVGWLVGSTFFKPFLRFATVMPKSFRLAKNWKYKSTVCLKMPKCQLLYGGKMSDR